MESLSAILPSMLLALLLCAGCAFLFIVSRRPSPRELGFNMTPQEIFVSLAVSIIVYYSVSMLVGQGLYKGGMDPTYAAILANFVMQFCMALFLLLAPFCFKSSPKFFGALWNAKSPLLSFFGPFLKGALCLLFVFPFVFLLLFAWNYTLKACGAEPEPQDMIGIFLATHTPIFRAVLIISLVVMAPLWEELFFRAGLYGALKFRIGFWPAIFISSFLFGLIHTSLYAFLPIFALGLFFALLYEKFGDIRVSIGAHAAFNFINMLLLIYAPEMSDI